MRVQDGPVKGVRRRPLEMIGGHITRGERLGELGLCSLEEKTFKGHHTVVHKGGFLLRLVTKYRVVFLT